MAPKNARGWRRIWSGWWDDFGWIPRARTVGENISLRDRRPWSGAEWRVSAELHSFNTPQLPQGLKPNVILELYAALKRRSSTVFRAVVTQPLKPSALLGWGGTLRRA